MLVIRDLQIAAFSRELTARFDLRALAHVKQCFPLQCAELGDGGALHYVRGGLKRARHYGFESEYDLLRFLTVLFTLGGGFDTNAEHSWTLPILETRSQSATERMDQLVRETYARLSPGGGVRPDEAAGDQADEPAMLREFDGIVWEDDYDPDYVPQSIVPEIKPQEKAPHPSDLVSVAVSGREGQSGS